MTSKKDKILDASLSLFLKKGFDETSISDILSETAIARGTLYYHFESKETIMDAIIERLVNQLVQKVNVIVDRQDISLPEKFGAFLTGMNITELTGNAEMLDYFHQPQNALFHEKSNSLIIKKISPVLAQLIQQGITEKIFETAYPEETAELILICIRGFIDEQAADLSKGEMQRRRESLFYNLARLLGLSDEDLPLFKSLLVNKREAL